jgi:hypothetical protein
MKAVTDDLRPRGKNSPASSVCPKRNVASQALVKPGVTSSTSWSQESRSTIMSTRTLSARISVVVAALAVASTWAQTPTASGPPGAGAQVSGQASGQAAVPNTVGARDSAGSETTARSGEGAVALASGSSVNAVLTKPVDSKRNKPGDPVSARTTQDARTEGGAVIPKGSQLAGHITRVQAQGTGEAASSIALVFDKAVTRDGREMALGGVGVQAVAAAEENMAAGAGDTDAMIGGGGASGFGAGMGVARGGALGGGLVGHTAGGVGGTLGSSVNGVAGSAGSLGASGAVVPQAGPGATGGLDASGRLMSASTGVFGLRGVSLTSSAAGARTESIMSSSAHNLHLDSGTRLLLSSQAGTSARGGSAGESGLSSDQTSRHSNGETSGRAAAQMGGEATARGSAQP